MPLDAFEMTCDPVKTAGERRLEPISAVGREMRCECGLDDKRLRHTLAARMVREPLGKFRRKTERMLGAHKRSHSQVVGRIERCLARCVPEIALHDALPLYLVVALFLRRLELLNRVARLGDDLFVLG